MIDLALAEEGVPNPDDQANQDNDNEAYNSDTSDEEDTSPAQ